MITYGLLVIAQKIGNIGDRHVALHRIRAKAHTIYGVPESAAVRIHTRLVNTQRN
jgi:hypothetical protein